MPLLRSQEMTEQAHTQICGKGEKRYATCEEFLKIFDQDMNGLYQLSFLLTGDHQKGERCFVAGIEDCVKENRVFREWARAWAKRVIQLHRVPLRLTPALRIYGSLDGHCSRNRFALRLSRSRRKGEQDGREACP